MAVFYPGPGLFIKVNVVITAHLEVFKVPNIENVIPIFSKCAVKIRV